MYYVTFDDEHVSLQVTLVNALEAAAAAAEKYLLTKYLLNLVKKSPLEENKSRRRLNLIIWPVLSAANNVWINGCKVRILFYFSIFPFCPFR